MIENVDPFIGTTVTDLPPATGMAATWWAPKPRIGNTHPGATYPFGMVSSCAYSGGYPTGYGPYTLSTEGQPGTLHEGRIASGITHFQQSGTGAIRKYYNYLRLTPMLRPLDDLGTPYPLVEEEADPGRYAAVFGNGVRTETTVGPKSAVHRFTFPEHTDARLVLDASIGGLAIPYSATVPLNAHLELLGHGAAQVRLGVEGVPLAVHIECDAPGWRDMLWYDRRLMPGGRRLDLDAIRPTTLRPFGVLWAGPSRGEHTVEIRLGFSLRGCDQARANLERDLSVAGSDAPSGAYDARLAATRAAWREHLGAVRITPSSTEQAVVHATAAYHAMIKPCYAPDESPSSTSEGPHVFDICTMWDIYRSQLPLLTTCFPERAVDLATAMLSICEQEGNLPIGYRMAKGADRFARQGSALAHTFIADLCAQDLRGLDWDWAMVHLLGDLHRDYGEDYLARRVAHPVSHTLDLAEAYRCTADIARHVGDDVLADQLLGPAGYWRNAFDPGTGLLIDSAYYEGGRWNYSFRLLHAMAERIELAGGDAAFVGLLDRFFGRDAAPVRQPGVRPSVEELEAGYALGRFQGLNNEPDYDAPWAYLWAGRPDRTAEVVHAVLTQCFGTGSGGLPGNDDSGGLSAWYLWATAGLWPVAGQDLFVLHSPAVEEAAFERPQGPLHITTSGFVAPERDGVVPHVQRIRVDGQDLPGPWVRASRLRDASHVHIDLDPTPSAWGTTGRPPPPGGAS